MDEDVSTRFDRLENKIQVLENVVQEHRTKIQNLEIEIRNLKWEKKNIKINHILGQCISKYLFNKIIQNLINNGENINNYNNWRDIPHNLYQNYGIDKHKLILLKDTRDSQCHPEPPDVDRLILHYYGDPNEIMIRNIVNVFYDVRTSSFK